MTNLSRERTHKKNALADARAFRSNSRLQLELHAQPELNPSGIQRYGIHLAKVRTIDFPVERSWVARLEHWVIQHIDEVCAEVGDDPLSNSCLLPQSCIPLKYRWTIERQAANVPSLTRNRIEEHLVERAARAVGQVVGPDCASRGWVDHTRIDVVHGAVAFFENTKQILDLFLRKR